VIGALDVGFDREADDAAPADQIGWLAAFDDEMRALLRPLKARRAVDASPPEPTPVRPI